MVTPIDGVTMSQNIPQYSQVLTTWESTNSSRLTPANLPRSCSVSVMAPPLPLMSSHTARGCSGIDETWICADSRLLHGLQ
jgi:hypothetical protein